jgi:putative endonuclease
MTSDSPLPSRSDAGRTGDSDSSPGSSPGQAHSSDHRRGLGAAGERLAAEHLIRRGYTIIERNFRVRFGEIDIIAHDDRTLVFCEVKTLLLRPRLPRRDPLEAVRAGKRLQVRRLAACWLATRVDRPRVSELRFDVIGVVLDAQWELVALEHLQAAF